MHKNQILMIVAMLILGSGLWADDPWQDYLTRMQESKSDQEQITLIQETIPKISDINNLRMLQDAWKRRDPESCKAFFKDQYLSNPKSAEHHYQIGRASCRERVCYVV